MLRRDFLRSMILAAAGPNVLLGVLSDRHRWKQQKGLIVPNEQWRFIEFEGAPNRGMGPYMVQALMELETKAVLRVVDADGNVRFYAHPPFTPGNLEDDPVVLHELFSDQAYYDDYYAYGPIGRGPIGNRFSTS